MRTLLTYRDYFTDLPGGIERHVHQLAHGLKPAVDVEVLVASESRRSLQRSDHGVKIRMQGQLFRFQGIPICPGLASQMRRGEYDVIHIHSPNLSAEWAALTGRIGSSLVATYHADVDRGASVAPIYRRFLRTVYERSQVIIVSSERLAESSPFLSSLPKDVTSRVRVVPLAVDIDRFTPATHRRDRPMTVLFVGRLRYYKGVDVLIRAMEKVEANLVVAGGGPRYREILREGRKRLGDRFTALGYVPDEQLSDLYRSADIFCLPSTSHAEAFGIALLEAMASGLPVVTTEVGTGTSVVNRHGETGLVVPPRSVSRLASALTSLASDEDSRREMGVAARRNAEAYGIPRMIGSVLRAYEEACS